MASGYSLPQINLGVQGGTQGVLTSIMHKYMWETTRGPIRFSYGLFNIKQKLIKKVDKFTDKFDDDIQKFQFCFYFDAPAREDCVLLLAACHNGQPDCTLSAAVFPWRPEENLKHTKKTEQTRTIRQIYRD
ncbi:hypothetical protein TNCV_2076081 [Trichonephila clavipes]|nr:hypothetical protein TNCV_2076081 [Trichonephila clavipes]